jgi:hypothetical protein
MYVMDRDNSDPNSAYFVGYRRLARSQRTPFLIHGENGLLMLTDHQYESVPTNVAITIDPSSNTSTNQAGYRHYKGTYSYEEYTRADDNDKESLILEGKRCRRPPSLDR